jgi:hypothetical protein
MPRREDEAFEEYDEDRPRRRRRPEEEEEDYQEAPPRRRRPRRPEMGWLDQQFANTSMVLLVLFPVCCGMIALIFSIVGVAACQDPKARRNATIVLIISVVWVVAVLAVSVINALVKAHR